MEKLVREELERWDSETSMVATSARGGSPSSSSGLAIRARSRPDSGHHGGVSSVCSLICVCVRWEGRGSCFALFWRDFVGAFFFFNLCNTLPKNLYLLSHKVYSISCGVCAQCVCFIKIK